MRFTLYGHKKGYNCWQIYLEDIHTNEQRRSSQKIYAGANYKEEFFLKQTY